jgi:hypothetical protein
MELNCNHTTRTWDAEGVSYQCLTCNTIGQGDYYEWLFAKIPTKAECTCNKCELDEWEKANQEAGE